MSNNSLSTAVARLMGWIGRQAESTWLRLLVETQGMTAAIRYLRNPNPRHSVDLLRHFGAEIGQETTIKRTLRLDNVSRDGNSTGDFRHIRIGRNCYIGDGVYFDLANQIILGDNAILSGGVSIITHADCNRSPYLTQRFPRTCAPVKIQQGAWIGFGATVLAGTTVGANSVVAAESLVADDVESESLYAGTPARKIRSLSDTPCQ